jgi:hypothetical protein
MAVAQALGTTDTTTPKPSDSFAIPFQVAGGSTALTRAIDNINSQIDSYWSDLSKDERGQVYILESLTDYVPYYPYASFAVSEVPVPAAVLLFASGLLGLIGISRRKRAA